MYIKDKLEYNTKTKSVNLSRSGEYHYSGSELGINDNKIYSVYRPKSTVHKTKEIIDKLGCIPILINHPENFVDLKDEMSYKNGGVGNTEVKENDDTEFCAGQIVGISDGAKELMKEGQHVSLGSTAEIIKSTDPRYDFEMHIIDVNHLAIVSEGRAGKSCSILDKANYKAIVLDELNINKKEKEMKVKKVEDTAKVLEKAKVVEDSADVEKVTEESETKVEAPAEAVVEAKDGKEIVDKAIVDKAFNDGCKKGFDDAQAEFKNFNDLKDSGIISEIKDSIGSTIDIAILKVLDKASFENDEDRKASINLVISQSKKENWNFQDMAIPKEKAKSGAIYNELTNN